MTPESTRSPSTRPGPMLGSCAGSPTSSRCVPSRQASTTAGGQFGVEHRGLVDHDEIGVERPALAPGEDRPDRSARSRVPAGRRAAGERCSRSAPVSSSSRFAARPVGAARRPVHPRAVASSTTAETVRLLPVPGPPVSRLTPLHQRRDDGGAAGRRRGRVTPSASGSPIGSAARDQPGQTFGERLLGHRVAGERHQPPA